ncbi:hypothetical protein ACWEV3_39760 [Saccharopolyspora sp. NPDC003752]
MAWAVETPGEVADRARRAIQFLKADIRKIAAEFALLADGAVV